MLPQLDKLAGHFGVSKPTVRKAIRPLADRGRAVMLRVEENTGGASSRPATAWTRR